MRTNVTFPSGTGTEITICSSELCGAGTSARPFRFNQKPGVRHDEQIRSRRHSRADVADPFSKRTTHHTGHRGRGERNRGHPRRHPDDAGHGARQHQSWRHQRCARNAAECSTDGQSQSGAERRSHAALHYPAARLSRRDRSKQSGRCETYGSEQGAPEIAKGSGQSACRKRRSKSDEHLPRLLIIRRASDECAATRWPKPRCPSRTPRLRPPRSGSRSSGRQRPAPHRVRERQAIAAHVQATAPCGMRRGFASDRSPRVPRWRQRSGTRSQGRQD